MRKILLSVLLLVSTLNLVAQGYTEFWFVAPEVYQGHGDRPIWMRISTTNDTARITLSQPASPSFTPISGTINPSSTLSIDLTTWIDSIENNPADAVHNYGLKLVSDNPVDAYYEEASANNPELFTMKGKNALGTEFWIIGQPNYRNHWAANLTAEAFDIVATQDNTIVTITVSNDIVGHAKGSTFTVQLNKGQTYSARSTSSAATISLTGSHVTSNYPIAITLSDDSIDEPESGSPSGWDLIGDQTIPVNLLGNQYITVMGYSNSNDERVYVEAIADSTRIYLDGSATPDTILNHGQTCDFHFTYNTLFIKASKPIYVYHLSGLPNEAGSAIIPQDSCTGSTQIGFYRTGSETFEMMVYTRNGNQGGFLIDGNNTLLTASDFNPVTGTANAWVYARKTFTTGQLPVGSHDILNNLGKFHMGLLNALGGSAEYGFYSDFSSLNLGPDSYLCPGDSIILDAGAGMTTYQWKKRVGNNWITIDTLRYYTVHDSGSYACTVTGDFCTLEDTIHYSFYANSTLDLGPDRTICQGTTTSFDPGSFAAYFWNTGYTGRILTTGLQGQYWVRVTNSSGCVLRDTVNLYIDSLPVTNHAINGPPAICNAQNNVLYTIQSLPYSTSYAWTLPAGVTGSSTTDSIYLSFSALFTPAAIKVHGHNSCGAGPDTSLFITVFSVPHLTNNPLNLTICNNTFTNLTLTSDVPGTLFTWTTTPSSGNISGYSNDTTNPTTFLNQQLTNTSNIIESVVYHITPLASGCTGPVTDFTVYINPTPTLTNSPLTKHQCNNQATNITLTTSVQGTLFTWTVTASSPQVTGYTNNTTPSSLINDILVNSGHLIDTVTYYITPVYAGCNGAIVNYYVVVYPTPDLSNSPATQHQCNDLPTNIILTSNVSGTLFTWTASGSTQITGYKNNAVPTVTLDDTLINSGFANGTATYHITPAANGCGGSVIDFTVTVYPTPDVYFNPASQVICSLQTTNIANFSHVAGASYSWTTSSGSAFISGYSPGAGGSIRQTLVNTGTDAGTVTYFVTPVANGCKGISSSVVVTVDPNPIVTFTSCFDTITILSAKPIKLKGGIPLGGVYSGPGVNSLTGVFTPAVAGVGTQAVTYSYTNRYLCTSGQNRNIIVQNSTAFTCGNNLTDIRDNKTYATVQIGSQCWMAANLNFGSVLVSTQDQRDNCISEKYCYNDNPANCTNFGGLYQWDELMLYDNTPADQGFCPPGWHIPTKNEWNTLFVNFINNGFAGSPLKYSGYSGFNALLSGNGYLNTSWNFQVFATFFWSSNLVDGAKAWAHGMNNPDPSVSAYSSNRINAFSVRCIQD
ncbi:MAG: PKD-like domain-containing protein [Bacteroidales bacterium]|jgi:uncharacterized protein (TIGR02145 family)